MATRTPSYLRLADHLAVHGNRHDLKSGFGISGFDVKPWPKGNPAAEKFCKSMVSKGIFEEAGKAEYDEVVDSNPDLGEVQKVVFLKPGQLIPEYELREKLETAGEKVAKRVGARLQQAADDELLDDDDPDNLNDEDLAGDAQRPTRREKVKGRTTKTVGSKKSKTKVVEDEEDEDENGGDGGGGS